MLDVNCGSPVYRVDVYWLSIAKKQRMDAISFDIFLSDACTYLVCEQEHLIKTLVGSPVGQYEQP